MWGALLPAGAPAGDLLPGTTVQDLASDPFVRLARGFLSPEECDHLRGLVEARLLKSHGVVLENEAAGGGSNGTGAADGGVHWANFAKKAADAPVCTARAHPIPRRYDGVVAAVEARAAQLVGVVLEVKGSKDVVPTADTGSVDCGGGGEGKVAPTDGSSSTAAKSASCRWRNYKDKNKLTMCIEFEIVELRGKVRSPRPQIWMLVVNL